MLCVFIYMLNLKKTKQMSKQNRNRFKDTENKSMVSRGVSGREMSEIGEGD